MKLGASVKTTRKSLGWSQTELAERAKVAQTTISKIEQGVFDDAPARAESLPAVMAALGMEPLSPGATNATMHGAVAALQETAADIVAEEALGRAFVPGQDLPRDASSVAREVAKAMDLFGDLSEPKNEALLVKCARAWLDAAADLRKAAIPVDTAALLVQVTIVLCRREQP